MISLEITAFEQGTINTSGVPSSSTTRVRTSGYIVLENSFSLASLSVVSTTGKAVQWSFIGYDPDGKMVCNLYWNASGANVDITPYIGKIATFRSVLCYTAGGNITPGEIDSAVMTLYTGWTVSDGVLDSDCLPDRTSMPQYSMTKPYPAALWRVEGGVLTHALLPGYVPAGEGAFKYAEGLQRAVFPASLRSVGAESFRYTALTSVTLPAGCTYSDTSFPEGCEVRVSGDFSQIYTSGGKALLDCRGRRIFAGSDDNG